MHPWPPNPGEWSTSITKGLASHSVTLCLRGLVCQKRPVRLPYSSSSLGPINSSVGLKVKHLPIRIRDVSAAIYAKYTTRPKLAKSKPKLTEK